MLRAVPAMICIAPSMSLALRSGSLVSAISRSLAPVILPTVPRLGTPDPLSIPAAFRMSTAAGGVFVMKVKERSSKTVISTGMIVPTLSCVWALYAFVNSMMLIPCWPSAGPTGGAGLAFPAGICSLMIALTFFATDRSRHRNTLLDLLDLLETQFGRRFATEDGNHHFELALLRIDLGHLARKVAQRARNDLDLIPDGEFRLGLGLHNSGRMQDAIDLSRAQGGRGAARTHEAGYARGVFHQRPGVVRQGHLDQDVAGEDPLL